MYNEGPSQEDIERFSDRETGYCPHCGSEIWDDVIQCPSCNSWLKEGTSHRDPVSGDFRKRFIVIVVVVVLIGFLWGFRRFF
jgi:DNA-directed RNA polymerase subunit RPC12/RpoP